MDSRLVVVIEGDEPTASRLAAAIREADYEVVVAGGARAGLDVVVETKPDCVVCDVELPDEDGYWVARNLREHPSQVSVTPLVLLSEHDDADARIAGFSAGADVFMCLPMPFRADEVLAQVDALIKLSWRLRQRRDSILSMPPEQSYGSMAIEGDLRQMSIATVLSVLGMERRTGVFEVVSKKRRAQIEIAGGYVVHGTIGGTRVTALAAMGLMLTWKVGRFSFVPLPPCEPPPSRRTVQGLLLDAAKAEDEAAASVRSLGGMRGGPLGGAAFGGPPSRPDDTGPPSSRAMREASAPVSLAFDLISSRRVAEARGEELPEAEVAAAVDPAVDAYEGKARRTSEVPTRPAPDKSEVPTRPAPDQAAADEGSVDVISLDSISIDLGEPFEPDDAGGPVHELAASGERMLIHEVPAGPAGAGTRRVEEITLVSGASGPRLAPTPPAGGPRAAPTPPAGTPIQSLRRTPAIMPPDGGAHIRPLPRPPAPPRPAVPPRPPGSNPRATQKKN